MQFKINDHKALNITQSKQGKIVHLQHLNGGKWENVYMHVFPNDWSGNMINHMEQLYRESKS